MDIAPIVQFSSVYKNHRLLNQTQTKQAQKWQSRLVPERIALELWTNYVKTKKAKKTKTKKTKKNMKNKSVEH